MDSYEQAVTVGPYTVSRHPPIPVTEPPQVNVIWILHESGEGMSVDLDRLWREDF